MNDYDVLAVGTDDELEDENVVVVVRQHGAVYTNRYGAAEAEKIREGIERELGEPVTDGGAKAVSVDVDLPDGDTVLNSRLHYRAARTIATHPKKWVTVNEAMDAVNSSNNQWGSWVTDLHDSDIVQRRERENGKPGHNPYEYRVKDLYRRELLADAADTTEGTA